MEPLASRVRPSKLSEFIGQDHLVGKNGALTSLITNKKLHSMIFWGPPGVGKTTLSKLIAKETNHEIYSINAISSGVKDIRNIIEKARGSIKLLRKTPILFIDEIHRFSKSQQDSLLKAVEDGTVILIGATTENPSFEVISPLLSRSQVYILNELGKEELTKILENAIEKENIKVKLIELDNLLMYSSGDARKLLSYFEIILNETGVIDNKVTSKILQKKSYLYDKSGENHYDIISAFIKSIRGSDPQAALYYLAYMLEGGEDIKFIARRLVILANEDIGLANSNAAILAQSIFETINLIGMPEARIPLSHLVVYLATSPKSNSAYVGIDSAITFVKESGNCNVPLHLRNKPTKLMKDLGYGKDYKYAHSHKDNFIDQEFFPEDLKGTTFYKPSKNPKEDKIKEKLEKLWGRKYSL